MLSATPTAATAAVAAAAAAAAAAVTYDIQAHKASQIMTLKGD